MEIPGEETHFLLSKVSTSSNLHYPLCCAIFTQMSSEQGFRAIHYICHGPDTKLLSYKRDHKPRLVVDSGSEVSFDNTNSDFLNIKRGTTSEDIISLGCWEGPEDLEKLMGPIYVNGAVYVNGAEPGDILQVEILQLKTGPWGWSAPSSPALGC